MGFSSLFTPFLASFFVSLLITPLIIKFYKKNKWLDDPKKRSHPKNIHTKAVPRGGGIPIFLAILLVGLFFLPIDKHLLGLLAGALVLTITGFLDDLFDLNPYVRIGIGFLAASCVVAAGIGIPFLTNPLSTGELIYLNQPQIPIYLLGKTRTIWILADIFALFWIVGIMNFVNWSKGLDGQLPGTAGIAAIVIALLSLNFSADIAQWETSILAIIVAGAFIGFLPWNFFPQKIMPGYGGGSLAGYFLAILAILSTTKVGTLIIVLGIPLIDAVFVMIRRVLAGRSPVWGDTRHLHHTLMKLGWSKRKIAIFYWVITAFLGFVALKLNSQQKFYTIILLAVFFAGFLLWIKLFSQSSSQLDHDNG
jgi:UDP-GlcNAc:undecaprenyl-phosphate/decaprenyl-phosphate GlcNAc-1-phosphate transferase